MQRRDLSITTGLCVSLLVHGGGMIALTEYEIHTQNSSLHRPPFNLRQWLAQHPQGGDHQLISARPEPVLAQAIPEQKLPPLPEFDELFGERGAKGKAVNASLGEQLMQARQAPQEQAALTPNPGAADTGPSEHGNDGNGGASQTTAKSVDKSPAMVLLPFGPPVDPEAPFAALVATAPPPLPPKLFKAEPQVIGIPTPTLEPWPVKSIVAMADSPATKPVDIASTTRPSDVASAAPTTSPFTDMTTTQPVRIALNEPTPEKLPAGQMPTTTQPTLVKVPTTPPRDRNPMLALASTADGVHLPEIPGTGNPGSNTPSHNGGGEAGNQSESESDPFSKTATFIYRNGKVEARDGRKVKTVRPKLTEAGIQAVIAMEEPLVVLAVKIDDQGKVTGVDYVRKSGSNEVDLPTYLAAWKWEFEPSKDKAGNPKADAFVIPFVWR